MYLVNEHISWQLDTFVSCLRVLKMAQICHPFQRMKSFVNVHVISSSLLPTIRIHFPENKCVINIFLIFLTILQYFNRIKEDYYRSDFIVSKEMFLVDLHWQFFFLEWCREVVWIWLQQRLTETKWVRNKWKESIITLFFIKLLKNKFIDHLHMKNCNISVIIQN